MADPPSTLTHIATCSPPSTHRTWQSAPHPYLPLLATASSDKTVRIFSLTTFKLLSTISGGHKRSVRSVAWKPGLKGERESVLATGSFDFSVGIWKADNSRRRVGGGRGIGENTDDGAGRRGDEDEDDGSDDDDEEEDYRFSVILDGPDSEIKSVAWSCNGTFLAMCSRDKSVWVWEFEDATSGGPGGGYGGMGLGGGDDDDDGANLQVAGVLQEHDGDVKCVAWHPTEENCLASSSYDDMIRVWREDADGEWTCVAVCEGHDGTVWSVAWEPQRNKAIEDLENGNVSTESGDQETGAAVSGPRIISCSDDLTVRLWRRRPKAKPQPTGPRYPSTIRSTSDEEDWYEEAKLPKLHDRAIYAVSWSQWSKRVVTCGSDGKIVVYEEKPTSGVISDTVMSDGDSSVQTNGHQPEDGNDGPSSATQPVSQWTVVAELDAAHGVFEVNHVCWVRRYDKDKQGQDEEVIVSTGDDGEVRVWALH
ncbi:MAG: Cytosolic iron-sulfur protein assembly protein [Alyxoria varia]|nr:MAG: Cytosolic iron-sulfur protein assembly protein [Alyxoria varia]